MRPGPPSSIEPEPAWVRPWPASRCASVSFVAWSRYAGDSLQNSRQRHAKSSITKFPPQASSESINTSIWSP